MRRLFWIALGATAGVLVARRLTKAARQLTPDGAAERVSGAVGGLTQAVREFADDVKAGMAERDLEERIIPCCTVRWITEALHRRAWERFVRADRRGVSLVDCTSFELMQQEGIDDVLALDHDFADAGFRLLPALP